MTNLVHGYNVATIGGVSGATVELSSPRDALSNAVVNRLLIITSGNARRQIRRIVGRSGNTLTLDHAFDASPFPWIVDVDPAVGDSCAISYTIDDIVNINANLTIENQNVLTISGSGLTLSGNAYLHLEGLDIRWNCTNIAIGSGGGLILGWYAYVAGEAARPERVCNILDTAPNIGTGNQMRINGGSFGIFHQYGGNLRVRTAVFWRFYKDGTAGEGDVDARMIGVLISGNFGARVGGDRSILIASGSRNQSALGLFNPRSSVAHSDVGAVNSRQAAYAWLNEGANSNITLDDVVGLTRGIRINVGGGGGNGIITIRGKKSQIDELAVFISAEGGGSARNHTCRYGNDVLPSIVNENTTPYLGTATARTTDINGDEVNMQTINDGQFVSFFGRHTDLITKYNTGANEVRNLGGPHTTLYAPITITTTAWRKRPHSQAVDLADTYDLPITLLDDPDITESDQSIVDAYPPLTTAAQIYDAIASYNATRPGGIIRITKFGDTLDFGALPVFLVPDQTSGVTYAMGDIVFNVQIGFIVEITSIIDSIVSGEVLSLGAENIRVIDGRAGVFIRIGASLAANIVSTGAVAIPDEGLVDGTITDSSGVRLRITLPVGSVIRGEYRPVVGQPEIDIPFEVLTEGVKIVKIPANSRIRLYSKVEAMLPRFATLNAGAAGILYEPEQTAMNGNVLPALWVADLSSPSFSNQGAGRLDLEFSTLANIPQNADVDSQQERNLGTTESATLINAIHKMANYAEIAIATFSADLLATTPNNEIEMSISLKMMLADTIGEDLLIEIPMLIFGGDEPLATPKNNHANKARVFVGLNLIGVVITLSEEAVSRIFQRYVGLRINEMDTRLETMEQTLDDTASAAQAIQAATTQINISMGEVLENQELTRLILVKDINPLPTLQTTSHIGGVAVANNIITITRTAGEIPESVATWSDLGATQRFNVGGAAGATSLFFYVRNPGATTETVTIHLELHINGQSIDDLPRNATLTLPADGLYRPVHFRVHGIAEHHLVDRLRLSFAGLNTSIEVLSMSAHRIALPGESGGEVLEDIQSKVTIIYQTIV